MSQKVIRLISTLIIILITAVLFQNCGSSSIGFTDDSLSLPSDAPASLSPSLYCPKTLPNSFNFNGKGGGVWSHELVGALPNLQIKFSFANTILEYAKQEGNLRVPDPGECSWTVARINKDPSLNRGRPVPLSAGDLSSEHYELIVFACTDSWARFVSLHHFTRVTNPADGVIIAGNYGVWSDPVFQGVIGLGENCVDKVDVQAVRFKKNFIYNVVTVTRQDGKQDLSFITFDGSPVTRVFRMPLDLGSSQSKYAAMSNMGALELSDCPGNSPTAIIQITDTSNKFEIKSTIQCGSVTASPEFVIISREK